MQCAKEQKKMFTINTFQNYEIRSFDICEQAKDDQIFLKIEAYISLIFKSDTKKLSWLKYSRAWKLNNNNYIRFYF